MTICITILSERIIFTTYEEYGRLRYRVLFTIRSYLGRNERGISRLYLKELMRPSTIRLGRGIKIVILVRRRLTRIEITFGVGKGYGALYVLNATPSRHYKGTCFLTGLRFKRRPIKVSSFLVLLRYKGLGACVYVIKILPLGARSTSITRLVRNRTTRPYDIVFGGRVTRTLSCLALIVKAYSITINVRLARGRKL